MGRRQKMTSSVVGAGVSMGQWWHWDVSTGTQTVGALLLAEVLSLLRRSVGYSYATSESIQMKAKAGVCLLYHLLSFSSALAS